MPRDMTRENLVSLQIGFDALVRAGDDSLRAAYTFGQIIDALNNLYTYQVMGDALRPQRSAATVAKYAQLFRKYSSVDDLLKTAHHFETFDVSILTGSEQALSLRYGYQCGNCGSWDTHRRRKEEETA